MARLDARKKAAECEALAESSPDAKLREKFVKLRDSWIRIANSMEPAGNPQRADSEQRT
jgi:hypothetical protein